MGEQRRTNYALQPMSKEAFLQVVTADQPEAPAYFTYDAVLNSEERPTLDQTLAHVNAMTLDDVLALQAAGAQILDTRDPAEFGAAHLAGSINIGLGGQYATWAGTVLDGNHPIVIIAEIGRENESATRLARIGFDHIVGYLQDGLHSLKSRPDLTVTTDRVSAPYAAELLSSPDPPLAIDVRAPREREREYIAGSLSLPLNHLVEKSETLPKGRPLLVYCAGGYRSSIAASLLERNGFDCVSEIAGGLAGWKAAGLAVCTA
jgi:rhodanese-related sulfurtransferase